MGERTVLLQTMGRQEQEAGRARPRRSYLGSNAFSTRVSFNSPRTQTDRAGSGRLRARHPTSLIREDAASSGSWLYTATNATLTNRTRHEGQLWLGTSLHILENTAAGAYDIVCPRRHARVCWSTTRTFGSTRSARRSTPSMPPGAQQRIMAMAMAMAETRRRFQPSWRSATTSRHSHVTVCFCRARRPPLNC